MRASQIAPSQPNSNSGVPLSSGGEDERGKVEHLQGLVDKQALQLRRRNEELLDLQRNHEAFREKFVLFREGMRSKTDESDGRFRKLEADLRTSQQQLVAWREQNARDASGNEADRGAAAMVLRVREREATVSALRGEVRELTGKVNEARDSSVSDAAQKELEAKDSQLKDLRGRVERQAEHIRAHNSKMAETQSQGPGSGQGLSAQQAEHQMQQLEAHLRELEARAQQQATSLKAQAVEVAEATQVHEDEQRAVKTLHQHLETSQQNAVAFKQELQTKTEQLDKVKQQLRFNTQQVSVSTQSQQTLAAKMEAARQEGARAGQHLPRARDSLEQQVKAQEALTERAEKDTAHVEAQSLSLRAQVQQLRASAQERKSASDQRGQALMDERQVIVKFS